MDVVMTPGKEEPNSGEETKGTENTIVTEEAPEKYGGCFDSRDRRKSKYLSSPYTNIGHKQKDLPDETEDLRTPCPSQKAEASSVANNPSNRSSLNAKLGNKRFRNNWFKKFVSCNTMSSNREFMNTSTDELLSGLCSTAIDCMFPIGNKSFDLVEQFFCRYRVSNYHDEAELATSLVNAKEEKLGKPVGDLLDTKSKKRKNNKMENTVRRKRKSLSGLSDENANTSSGDSLKPGRISKQKRKVKEITSVHEAQNVDVNLNGSSSKYSSVPEVSQNLGCLASEGKAMHKNKRRGKIEAKEHQSTQINSVHTDTKSHNCSSLVIDLQFTSPPIPVDIPEKNKYENKEELVFLALNPESRVSQEGPVGSITDQSLLASTKAEIGTVLENEAGLKNTMGKAAEVPLNTKLAIGKTGHKNSMVKAAEVPLNTILGIGTTALKNSMERAVEKPLNTKLAIEIPDLNGTGAECNSISPEYDGVNFFSPELKLELSRSLSTCSTLTETNTYNRLEEDGESLGNCLLLQFAPGLNIPSKEDLMTTFCRFGPLKGSETQLLKDTGSAQVVFVRSADAAAAFHSLKQNKFVFGSTLVDCKLQHLSAASPPAEQLVTPAQPTGYMTLPGVSPIQPNGCRTMPSVTSPQPSVSIAAMPGVNHTQPTGSTVAMPGVIPTQPTGSVAKPGETPPLQLIKQNLQMMTSILENSGSSLSPQVRAKLDTEIKTLMRKVDSRTNA